MSNQATNRQFALSEELLNKVLVYLGAQKYSEVQPLIQAIVQQAKLVAGDTATATSTAAAVEAHAATAHASNGSGAAAN